MDRRSSVTSQKHRTFAHDKRTCKTCSQLDGKIFDVAEAVEGENYPPIHPMDRCTTAAHITDEDIERMLSNTGEDRSENLQEDGSSGIINSKQNAARKRAQEDNAASRNSSQEKRERLRFVATGSRNEISEEYAQVLKARFESGTEIGKRVYDRFVPAGGQVSVGDRAQRGSRYLPPGWEGDGVPNSIETNYENDLANERGSGTSWFHEHGHFVDHRGGVSSAKTSQTDAFRNAILTDYENWREDIRWRIIERLRDAQGDEIDISTFYVNEEEVDRAITLELIQPELIDVGHSVSDLCSGCSMGKVRGRWYHKESYWKKNPYRLPSEAFAHMFEAQFDQQKRALLEHYFPTAYSQFLEILEGLLNETN